jgi:hypothetical protein
MFEVESEPWMQRQGHSALDFEPDMDMRPEMAAQGIGNIGTDAGMCMMHMEMDRHMQHGLGTDKTGPGQVQVSDAPYLDIPLHGPLSPVHQKWHG